MLHFFRIEKNSKRLQVFFGKYKIFSCKFCESPINLDKIMEEKILLSQKNILSSVLYYQDLYSKVSSRNALTFGPYKNINQGQSVCLIASGPTTEYFSPIRGIKYCAVNGSFLYDKVDYDYFFVQDYKAVKQYLEDSLTARLAKAKRFYGIFSPKVNDFTVPEDVAIRHGAKRYYMHSLFYGKRYNIMSPLFDYAENLMSQPIICHGTVALTALQFLLWTNPQKIYLVGCDCSMQGHFNDKMGKQQMASAGISVWLEGWKKIKEFANEYYPETEIILVNPVGLKGMFRDVYTEAYLADHPEIDRNTVEILENLDEGE